MMKQDECLKLGFIGCGRATQMLHLPALQQLSSARVIALADVDPERLKSVADQFHVKQRYTNFRDLLDDPAIDAVAVCVPVEFHIEIALAALAAEKHLFIEKPLALNLDQCDQLIQKAETVNKKITVGFNLRHHRLVNELQSLLQQGTLGEIDAIRSNWTSAIRHRMQVPAWRNRRESGGGALFEIAVHHFDLWRLLLQSEVAEVYAAGHSDQWPDVSVSVTARMANNVLASGFFSEQTSDNNELEIYGSNGRLRVSFYRYDGLEYFSLDSQLGGVSARVKKLQTGLKELPKGLAIMRQGGDYKMSYRSEWQHFIDTIQSDYPVKTSLDDGKRALQIVLAAIESSTINQPVKIV
jgi:myo-inositol 2-dehydrogenase / D-chiro-inositol 1-dehydrogenase